MTMIIVAIVINPDFFFLLFILILLLYISFNLSDKKAHREVYVLNYNDLNIQFAKEKIKI